MVNIGVEVYDKFSNKYKGTDMANAIYGKVLNGSANISNTSTP